MSEAIFAMCCFCGRQLNGDNTITLNTYQIHTSEYGTLQVPVCGDCARDRLGDD